MRHFEVITEKIYVQLICTWVLQQVLYLGTVASSLQKRNGIEPNRIELNRA
jgi:hypothetical protein